MPAPPKPNERTIYLKGEGRGKVSFVFDDDKNEKIPDDVTLYYRNKDDEEKAIGKVPEVLKTLRVYDDKNFLHNATRQPIGFVEEMKNKIYIKQSELAGGNDPQPPQVHPGLNEINNLVVGNEYEFVVDNPWFMNQPEPRIYRGTLMSLTHEDPDDPQLGISNYTINGVDQEEFITLQLSSIRAILTEPSVQQPIGGGKKKKAKKTKKAKKMKKTKKSKKTKKTGRKSIRRRV